MPWFDKDVAPCEVCGAPWCGECNEFTCNWKVCPHDASDPEEA